MALDVTTLTFLGGLITFTSGLFLLMNWYEERTALEAFWWGMSNCGVGIGIGLLAVGDSVPFVVSHVLAAQLIDVCSILTWVAARIFNRGVPRPAPVVCGALVWLVADAVLGTSVSERVAATVSLTSSSILYAAAAFEFWAGRHQELRGRWPMISLLALYTVSGWLAALGFSVGGALGASPAVGWLGVIYFVGPVYALGSSTLLITMMKDRTERRHEAAALTDALTGLLNRRGFLDRAERLIDRSTQNGESFALLVLDLDHFKSINDSFGHPVGDDVLKIFARTLSRMLRPADLPGRIGGEEFVAMLPGCTLQAAAAIAGRIRAAFQADAQFVDGQRIGATVSVGVVASSSCPCDLAGLIRQADAALYRAKASGRNRVSVAQHGELDHEAAKIVRIA